MKLFVGAAFLRKDVHDLKAVNQFCHAFPHCIAQTLSLVTRSSDRGSNHAFFVAFASDNLSWLNDLLADTHLKLILSCVNESNGGMM